MFEELKKVGISENEAKVYIALLELGSATAQQIAQKSRVTRPTTYLQLDALMRMGLVSSFENASRNKKGATKTFFRAENPEYLKRLFDRQQHALQERKRSLEDLLPQLATLYASEGQRPTVRFFEGKEGLLTMQEEFLKTKTKKIEAISPHDEVEKVFPSHLRTYSSRRVKRGIHSKLIYTNIHGPIFQESDKAMLRESRYVPREKFPFFADMTIYDDNVALAVFREPPIGIIINSKAIANSMRWLFYLAWEGAEKYQNNTK